MNYLFALIATVFVLGMTSCDPNENTVTPDNPLEEYVGSYTLTSSLNGTDETLPSNPDFESGNNLGQTSKHWSFSLNADGTGLFVGNVATDPMKWTISDDTLIITIYGRDYNLYVISHTSSELVARLSGNVNTYNIN